LSGRPSFTLDPFFHAGLYYVQEASGMILEQALKQCADLSQPLRILDLCAAPGGKSTLIQSMITAESLLVSNEVIKSRVNILQENMIKWGGSNVIVTNNDPKDFSKLENYFDVIVIDAPCSGSGLFRRDPKAITEWSKELVNLCSLRQQRILADAWSSLKKDGVLIYSTCSYSKDENEDVVDRILEKFSTECRRLTINNNWGIVETISDMHQGYGYRFYPDKLKGEGFFIACLQKKEGGNFSYPRLKGKATEKPTRNEKELVKEYFKPDQLMDYFKYNGMIYSLHDDFFNDLFFLQNNLYLKKAGVLAGKVIGDEFIPEHELALSTIASPKIPFIEVDKKNAIHYLRKEEIQIPSSSRGWTLVQYKRQNLGWVKILQNRINNYYPKSWKIRTGIEME
jgi:NOL1/NOP2/fmu family ribosome biogenesis protein/23S rRNA U2552 (ribose-2'-O)-methylase RlmE/FtsJ